MWGKSAGNAPELNLTPGKWWVLVLTQFSTEKKSMIRKVNLTFVLDDFFNPAMKPLVIKIGICCI